MGRGASDKHGGEGTYMQGFGEGKGPQVRLSVGWENNIKMDLKDVLHEGVK